MIHLLTETNTLVTCNTQARRDLAQGELLRLAAPLAAASRVSAATRTARNWMVMMPRTAWRWTQ